MEINWKYIFGSIAIASLVGLQLGAWYFGYDGQVFSFTTSAIVAILAFITGVNLTSIAAKHNK